MHNSGYKSALARRACRYSDTRPPRKADGVLLESEIPPHMQGKVGTNGGCNQIVGITPAYAGKSIRQNLSVNGPRDHPRVCGEKSMRVSMINCGSGSPPHMRGKDIRCVVRIVRHGITPAYAGKRGRKRSRNRRRQDHPRVCGEKTEGLILSTVYTGSPPRMRGKVSSICDDLARVGITPAYAGKSP